MGFVSQKEPDHKVFEYIRNASTYYSYHNNDGFGFICSDITGENKVLYSKSAINAFEYWSLYYDIFKDLKTKSLIYHCRLKASGELDDESTHPFIDDTKSIAISHNGVLYNYDDAKKELTDKGYIFKTNVDSELLLYAYIEYGDEFIKKLDEFKVRGSINLLIFHFDGRIRVYSDNGSFKYIKIKDKLYGASDDEVLDFMSDKDIDLKSVDKGHILTVKDGEVIDDKNIETFKEDKYVLTGWSCDFKYLNDTASDKDLQNSASVDSFGYFDAYDGNMDTDVDVNLTIDKNNNTYSSEYAKKTYAIENIDVEGKFIDELGCVFDDKEFYEEYGVFLTKSDKLVDIRSGNFINIKKRGIRTLTDGELLDTSTGEIYADYTEYKRLKGKKGEAGKGKRFSNKSTRAGGIEQKSLNTIERKAN